MKYKVLNFFIMPTKYGRKVVANLENGKYFLPPRYGQTIKGWSKDPEDIDCEDLYLMYEGNREDRYHSPILKFVHNE